MHTPDDPTPTAKRRQTRTHPGTVNAIKTYNAEINTWAMDTSHDCKSDAKSIILII